jgi:hypothetical protein
MGSSQLRQLVAVIFLSIFTSICSAACQWRTYPDEGATCNAAPDTTSYLETVIFIAEDNAGECQAFYAGNSDRISQDARVTYTGNDGSATVASAFSTVSDAYPQITGTYTFNYNVRRPFHVVYEPMAYLLT